MTKIILASTSIYRQSQLKRLNVEFTANAPEVDETPLKQSLNDHVELSRQLALMKAQAVHENHPNSIVIGGDQVASFDSQILSKPGTKENAFKQLKLLNGKTHRLITSVAVIADHHPHVHTCISTLTMRTLSDEELWRYIELDEPTDCCGAYKIEEHGICLFSQIDCDDFTSIVGMPLIWLGNTLSELGVAVP